MTKYVNILNDDAFKVVIFTPGNEELLARMIEIMIPGMRLKQLKFEPTEQHGLSVSDKISNFDAVCTSESGDTCKKAIFRDLGRANPELR